MATQVLQPNGIGTVLWPEQVAIYGGAGSINAAISDSSDTTYVRRDVGTYTYLFECRFGTFTIPANNEIAVVVPTFRYKTISGKTGFMCYLAVMKSDTDWYHALPAYGYSPTNTSISNWSPALGSVNDEVPKFNATYPYGVNYWTQEAIDNAATVLYDQYSTQLSNAPYLYEHYLTVYYLPRPSLSGASNPATPITTTSYPSLDLTASATTESWQNNSGGSTNSSVIVEVALFTSAQYGAGGFDAGTSDAVQTWGRTETVYHGPIPVGSPGTLLKNYRTTVACANGTYRWYYRTRRPFRSGQWTSWTYTEFVQNVTVPSAPTTSATVSDATGRATILVTPQSATSNSDPHIFVERSEDSGVTWTPVRGTDGEGLQGTFGVEATIYDYEAKRGVALQYRARCTTLLGSGPERVVTAWATDSTVGTLSTTGWNLKGPVGSWANNMINVRVLADPDWDQTEDVGIFRPKGRTKAVVVAGSIGGSDAAIEIAAGTTNEWTTLEAIRNDQQTYYLESPFGWGRYVRLVARSWRETGTPTAPRRYLKASIVEVEAP